MNIATKIIELSFIHLWNNYQLKSNVQLYDCILYSWALFPVTSSNSYCHGKIFQKIKNKKCEFW